jgi:hypothetical protein
MGGKRIAAAPQEFIPQQVDCPDEALSGFNNRLVTGKLGFHRIRRAGRQEACRSWG